MVGGQFQFNADKSDVRNVNKCLPFARGRLPERIAGTHQFIGILNRAIIIIIKHFIELACSVRIGEHWSRSFFAKLWTSLAALSLIQQKKNETNISSIWTSH